MDVPEAFDVVVKYLAEKLDRVPTGDEVRSFLWGVELADEESDEGS